MTIICWTENGQKHWEELPGAAELAAATWQDRHPNQTIDHQFLDSSDLMDGNSINRRLFVRQCRTYGLSEDDFDQPVRLQDGSTGIIRGIEPGRRKYVIRIWSCKEQKYILCSAAYIRRARERYLENPSTVSGGFGTPAQVTDTDAPLF